MLGSIILSDGNYAFEQKQATDFFITSVHNNTIY
jgi:hypothetical protein